MIITPMLTASEFFVIAERYNININVRRGNHHGFI